MLFMSILNDLPPLVTENPGITPRNTTVVLKGRHSLLQRWMHEG